MSLPSNSAAYRRRGGSGPYDPFSRSVLPIGRFLHCSNGRRVYLPSGAPDFRCSKAPHVMNQLLTVRQVAKLLGISEGWVYQHSCGARRPLLPSVKLGRAVRFRLESLQEFLRQVERGN
jgi:excisionase family DNA binding protein